MGIRLPQCIDRHYENPVAMREGACSEIKDDARPEPRTKKVTKEFESREVGNEWGRRGSNPRPRDYEALRGGVNG